MESGDPLVSIIIPSYNSGAYVKDAIDSALAQTYRNIEIILMDDGSTDGTKEMLAPYIKDGKILYQYQENRGLPGARNAAIGFSRGAFVAFLDADDVFMPTKIEHQVAYFKTHPACGICYCDIRHFNDRDKTRLSRLDYEYYSGGNVFPELLKRNFIAPSTVMMHRAIIDAAGVFDETYRRSEDWEYWLRLGRRGYQFCFLEEPLLLCRIHTDSYSYAWSTKVSEKKHTLRIFLSLSRAMTPEDRRKHRMASAIAKARVRLYYAYFGNYLPPLQWLYKWLQRNRFK